MSSYYRIIACFTLCLAAVMANGNAPGNCYLNGSFVPPTQGDAGYASYCKGGYGRPEGVCNCVTPLNSCAQYLAGCNANTHGNFTPQIPSILYVGRTYNFSISIPYTDISTLCFLRPLLPQGLNFTQTSTQAGNETYSLSGTPQESMPDVEYGIASYRGNAVGGFAVFFRFAVQSCPQSEAVYPPNVGLTTSTIPVTTTTSAVPVTTSSLPTTCPNVGFMRCISTNQYQTCDHGLWQSAQTCQTGLVCKKNGNYVICDRP